MDMMYAIPYICGFGLSFKLDGFRLVYVVIAALMWLVTTVFSFEYFKSHSNHITRYYVFTLFTFFATVGVFLSADFLTTFVFFEIMSFTSYVWVAHNEDSESLRAASTYLAVAVIGGLTMLMGLFLLYSVTGTLNFDELKNVYDMFASDPSKQAYSSRIFASGLCILFGFAAKAGAFPLHIWLPKAHPVAPAPASALLSGVLTKAGVFGILVLSLKLFYGNECWGIIILASGVITMSLGALLALFSVDLKRTLACSSVSQIGFILVGIGTADLSGAEGAIASNGAFMHMVNHSLIKLALFICAGVIFMNVHKLNLNDIRGFGRGKYLLNAIFLSGALSIMGVPVFSGYVSKTYMHEAIVALHEMSMSGSSILSPASIKLVEWVFLISGGLTVAYMTKLYVCIFIEKNNDKNVQAEYDAMNRKYMNPLTAIALLIPAVILPVLGSAPAVTLCKLSELSRGFLNIGDAADIECAIPVHELFSVSCLKGAAVSIAIGAFVYAVIVRFYMMSRVPVNEYGYEDLDDAVSGKFKALRTDKSVAKSYVNRWSKGADLEDTVYRPLILKLLPFVFGVICRFLDCITDYIVIILRKTVYKDSKLPQELSEGNTFTHIIGIILNAVQKLKNRTVNKDAPESADYEHIMAVKYESVEESIRIVTRSLSFGLVLFCIGLLLTVSYILLTRM